ncbi:helix-turn-helix domain-containing protein [Symbiopectobacterium purcellii]|uniref:Helix-turn-helix domain-containing protein n=1 Tax=Symbiopectobacterium purcellii TaxID=2871826 RepID=A0ABX9AQJ7_9ENTR|nr:helix-turn-helix transcriptional regulator [Symbiopectobacterium purcellii]QZN97328.1 helix-turn-helix domain-containing protein [Symbiopectobacterium purcellii]
MKTLKERLAYAMHTTGKNNQTELGRQAGVPQSSISKILRGDSETSRHTGKLAAALGVSADWLINGTGSIFGEANQTIQAIDVSKNVKVFDFNGFTGNHVSWFSTLPEHFRAYEIKGRTGISQAPAGAIVIVDPEELPASEDLVLVLLKDTISVFRYHIGGDGKGYLSVDDSRVPLAPVSDLSSVLGPIVQVFIPELNK